MNIYLKKTLSILFAILMIVTMVPLSSLAAGDGVRLDVDLSEVVSGILSFGSDYADEYNGRFDEDGYVLTGTNEIITLDFYDNSDVILDDVTIGSFREYGNNEKTNLFLKGENKVSDIFQMSKADYVIEGEDSSSLTVPCFNAGGGDGTVTVNSGNVNVNMVITSDDYYSTIDCKAFTVNGGTVTASNNVGAVIESPVALNGGQLNIISTSPYSEAINEPITMKKGAFLTISSPLYDMLAYYDGEYYGKIEMAEGADENDSFFVRYDTDGEFVPVLDINSALDGKTYAEIKIDSHEHILDSAGVCDCGYSCPHENYADKKCPDCGIEGVVVTFNMTDSYGDGWNRNAIVIEQIVDGGFKKIDTVTLSSGDFESVDKVLSANHLYALKWKSGNDTEECSFDIAVDGEKVYECEKYGAEAFSDGQFLTVICRHNFTDGACSVCKMECGVDFKHIIEDDICTICKKYIYEIKHQPTLDEFYVELNNATDAKYQWCDVAFNNVEITDENATGNWNAFGINGQDDGYGVYENNSWSCYNGFYFVIELKKGETVEGQFSDSVYEANVVFLKSGGGFSIKKLTVKGNKFSFTADKNGIYGFYADEYEPLVAVVGLPKGDVTLKAYVIEYKYTPIEGATSSAFENPAVGERYACKVTCGDGKTVLTSDVVGYGYSITHQPTENEPYVELNSDKNASYQWYAVDDYVEITDKNAKALNYFDVGARSVPLCTYASYNKETGWSPMYFPGYNEEIVQYYFSIDLNAGDTVNLEFSSTPDDVVLLGSYMGEVEYSFDGKSINATVEESGTYKLAASGTEVYTVRAALGEKKCTKLDGENSAELKNMLYGKKYACEVIFADSSKEMSTVIDTSYKITHQPTEEEPYVELNCDTDASYQWCEVVYQETEITDENAEPCSADLSNSSYTENGWLFAEQYGYNEGDSILYGFNIDLKAGDILIVETTDEDADYSMNLSNDRTDESVYIYPSEDGKYYFNITEDGNYQLWTVGYADEYVRAVVGTRDGFAEIETEKSARIVNPVYGKCYACKVTFADGTTEMSEILDLSYRITHQPTAVEPYVELNNDEDASYKWFEKYYESEAVSSENADPFVPGMEDLSNDETFNAEISSVDAEGWWTPVFYRWSLNEVERLSSRYFIVYLNEGDVIKFEIDNKDNLTDNSINCGLLNGGFERVLFFEDGNTVEYVADSDGVHLVSGIEFASESEPAKIRATIDRINYKELTDENENALKAPEFGKEYRCIINAKDSTELVSDTFLYKYAITSQPSDNKLSVELNNEEATYQWYKITGDKEEITDKNATGFDANEEENIPVEMFYPVKSEYSEDKGWTPTGLMYPDEFRMFYFKVDLKKGDKIDVEFSGEFDHIVFETLVTDNTEDSTYIEPTLTEGNKASFVCEKDGLYAMIAGAEGILTARAYIDKREYTPIEGSTSSTYDATDDGIYACEVTFKDGSKEMSDLASVHIHKSLDAVKENVVPAKCGVEGSYDLVVYCEVCKEELSREAKTDAALTHVFKNYVQTEAPSCTAPGKEVALCENGCTNTDERLVPATNHQGTLVQVSAKAPTCKSVGYGVYEYCTACTYTTYNEIGIADHIDTNGDYKCDFGCGYEFAKPVTPTEPSTEPTTKPNVEDTTKPSTEPTTKPNVEDTTKPSTEPTTKPNVEDTTKPSTEPTTKPNVEDTTKPSTEPTTKPAEPEHKHTEVVVKGKAATCTEKGLTDGKKCSVCGRITVAQKEIPATGHKEVTLKAVAATYTKSGKTEGKKCSVCGTITSAQRKVARKKLKKVSSLKVKKSTSSSVTLSWKKVTGAVSYKVYYSTDGKKWKSVKVKKNTATIKKLKSGTQYRFKVRAFAGKYYGTASKIVKKTTRVKAPALSKVTSSKKKTATVTWKKVTRASGYVVEYSTSKKFTKKTTKTVKIKKGKTTKATLKKLKSGKKYYVRVKAYKTVNKKAVYGSYSKVKTVKVK